MACKPVHNEITKEGIVHVCSCGWRSRPCFSSMVASCEGIDHREKTTPDKKELNKSSLY